MAALPFSLHVLCGVEEVLWPFPKQFFAGGAGEIRSARAFAMSHQVLVQPESCFHMLNRKSSTFSVDVVL